MEIKKLRLKKHCAIGVYAVQTSREAGLSLLFVQVKYPAERIISGWRNGRERIKTSMHLPIKYPMRWTVFRLQGFEQLKRACFFGIKMKFPTYSDNLISGKCG